MEKKCRACKITKPATEFYGNNQKKDGLSSYCRACTLAKMKAAYVKKPPKPRPPEGFKKCATCKEVKPVAEFGAHRNTADGLQYSCRPCAVKTQTEWRRKHPEYHRANSKKWREKNEKNRHRHYENSVRHRIGAHVEHGTYARLLTEQEGKCAICKTTNVGGNGKRHFHLDHCHSTLKVRGLLCGTCNALLGYARDNIDTLLAAAAYLEHHHGGSIPSLTLPPLTPPQVKLDEKAEDDSILAMNETFRRIVP